MAAKKATRDQVQEESVSKPKAGVQQGAARKEAAATPLKTEPAATAAAPKKPAAQKAGVAPLELPPPRARCSRRSTRPPSPATGARRRPSSGPSGAAGTQADQEGLEAQRERQLSLLALKRGQEAPGVPGRHTAPDRPIAARQSLIGPPDRIDREPLLASGTFLASRRGPCRPLQSAIRPRPVSWQSSLSPLATRDVTTRGGALRGDAGMAADRPPRQDRGAVRLA